MKNFTYSFSNLKVFEAKESGDKVICAFDYRISLISSGIGVFRYGTASLPLSSSKVKSFVQFEDVKKSTMVDFLRKSMNGKLEEIEEEMHQEIIAINSMPVKVDLPWESEGGQGD
jgi:hypothetical protein